MKKTVSILLIIVALLSFSGCAPSVSETEMKATFDTFMDSVKAYDRDKMTELLDIFPDSSEYVYLDDIYNDIGYMELYRLAFDDLTYTVTNAQKNSLVVQCNAADIQKLFTNVSAMVLQMAFEDEALQNKLNENEENGIILVREMMLSLARDKANLEKETYTYTISFKKVNGKTVVVCDDELRTLITGRFYLSKNIRTDQTND